MKKETIKTLILITIACLVVSELFAQVADLFGKVYSFVCSIIVAIVYLYCGRRARANVRYYFWIYVPTILFVVLPMVWRVVKFIRGGESLVIKMVGALPFLISFIVPVGLLVVAYWSISGIEEQKEVC